MTKHYISTAHLSIEELANIVETGMKIGLSDEARRKVVDCRK